MDNPVCVKHLAWKWYMCFVTHQLTLRHNDQLIAYMELTKENIKRVVKVCYRLNHGKTKSKGRIEMARQVQRALQTLKFCQQQSQEA